MALAVMVVVTVYQAAKAVVAVAEIKSDSFALINPSSSFKINSSHTCAIFVNNSRFIFNHPEASSLIQHIFNTLSTPNNWNHFLDSFDPKYNRSQLSQLIEEFAKLKLILQVETSEVSRLGYTAKYDGTSRAKDFFKTIYLSTQSFNVSDLLNKLKIFKSDIVPTDFARSLKFRDDVADSLVVVLFSANEFSKIFDMNKVFKKFKIPWILIEVLDTQIKIGPIFNFKNSFCFNCYYLRLIARAKDRDKEMTFRNSANVEMVSETAEINPLLSELIYLELEKIFFNPTGSLLIKGLRNYDFERNVFNFAELTTCSVCDVCFPYAGKDLGNG